MARSIPIVTLWLCTFGLLASAKRIQQRSTDVDASPGDSHLDRARAYNERMKAEKLGQEELSEKGKVHECGEPKMNGVCKCDNWARSKWKYQCSECIDESKWGYGCVLDCPKACPQSCDFAGNCESKDKCPKNCKRNSRVEEPTDEDVCVNKYGLCQACDSGFYGEMCASECPGQCLKSPEGKCMRDGSCYNCNTGFFGPRCEKKCPSACPKCMMEDGVNDAGETAVAGSCSQACQGDVHGATCDQACPANCDRTHIKSGKASCSRDGGQCKNCVVGFWSPKCDQPCNSGCIGKKCYQSNGHCKKGCAPGFWGSMCEKACPEFSDNSKGCDRSDGFPQACDNHHFPSRDTKGGTVCKDCPSGCEGGVCDVNGHCTKKCKTGFFGSTCAKKCPPGCVGGCDKHSGDCSKCTPGFTGSKCSDQCHSQCATCVQFAKSLVGAYPGTDTSHCLSCPDADASELQTGSQNEEVCQCIKGAQRKNAKSKCECKQPEDVYFEAHFETNPKKCSVRCKENFEGEPLRPVIGNGTTKCIPQAFHNAIAVFWSEYFTGPKPALGGDCEAGEFNIVLKDRSMCLHKEFVQYVVGKDKVV